MCPRPHLITIFPNTFQHHPVMLRAKEYIENVDVDAAYYEKKLELFRLLVPHVREKYLHTFAKRIVHYKDAKMYIKCILEYIKLEPDIFRYTFSMLDDKELLALLRDNGVELAYLYNFCYSPHQYKTLMDLGASIDAKVVYPEEGWGSSHKAILSTRERIERSSRRRDILSGGNRYFQELLQVFNYKWDSRKLLVIPRSIPGSFVMDSFGIKVVGLPEGIFRDVVKYL